MSEDTPTRPARLRLWIGLVATVAAIAVTLRGVELSGLVEPLRRVSPAFVVALVGLHLLQVVVRAERWRELDRDEQGVACPRGVALRATAIGFLAINLFPLRVGEVVRPWIAARESGRSFPRALGTALADRTLDFTAVSLAGVAVLLVFVARLPGWMAVGLAVFAALSALPLSVVLGLLVREAATRRALAALGRLLPVRLRPRAARAIDDLCDGLSALKSPRRLISGLAWTACLWGIVIPCTFAAAFFALGISMAPPQLALAAFTTMVAVAFAVAAPSAPGFLGLYHLACREALTLFSIPSATAVAYGALGHATYWVPLTVVGSLALAASGVRLAELWRARPG